MRSFTLLILIYLLASGLLRAQEDYKKWLEDEKKNYQNFLEEDDRKFLEYLQKNWYPAKLEQGLAEPKPGPRVPPKPDMTTPVKDTVIGTRKPSKDVPSRPEPGTNQPPKIEEPVKKTDRPASEEKPKLNEPARTEQPAEKLKPEPGNGTQPQPKTEPPAQQSLPNAGPEKPPQPPETVNDTPDRPAPAFREVTFFNTNLKMRYSSDLRVNFDSPVNNEKVARFWKDICSGDYKEKLDELDRLHNSLALNDWGFAQLCYDYGRTVLDDENKAVLFTWFILTKNHYSVKLGYDDNCVYLLAATEQKMYNTVYLTINGEMYYCINLGRQKNYSPSTLMTYKEEYPSSSKRISFFIEHMPLLASKLTRVRLPYTLNGRDSAIYVSCDGSLVAYLENHPQVSLPVYFDAVPTDRISGSMLSQLRKLIAGKSETESLSFLLNFVQYVKPYKTDAEQFGRQKPQFTEEFIYYPYADCKSRSIFFSYIVRSLMHLEVIGLDYPDHIATAVRLTSSNPAGTYLMYNSKEYLICDPTYIGASIGMCMPEYQNVNPEVILLNNRY